MKLSAAITTIFMAVAASANPFRPASKRNPKSAYMNKLVKGAKATRKLEQEIDLTSYSLKFEQCQFVKTYSDELADDEDSATVLATQRFVIFRLCPEGYCSTCNYNYGEYVIDLETYLEATVQYQQELQEEMCNYCEENCVNQEADEEQEDQQEDEDGGRRLQYNVDCDTCYEECQKIENMEENGYVDATNFLECQMIYDPEDDGREALYAGPICASYGTKIKIGVFTDEECMTVDASKDVEDYLKDGDGYQMKLSHALLKTIYAEDTCISCMEVQEEDDNGDGDNQDAPETNEMCRALYEEAAKCEDSHGFEGAFYYNNGNNNNGDNQENQYYNQEAQEELVCDFISSLQSGTYDETGEIIISGGSSVVGGGSKTTGGQKFALTFFILGTVGLAVYSAMLHSKLTKGGKADLSTQGGAMA
ncbi:expressed unknown protein [Seminavis robusta]|uniref:Uncharacterized protein n=1 Tax=Seminavis robusta TaxID=568900 RepID=A0A9N8DHE3_9STRA|nr:expressed unknown protein [Seminavis robusta]|eukprot:Sro89_g047060.1 n/a (421) ;mRNA; f:95195-96538